MTTVGNESKKALPSNSTECCNICKTTINDKLNFGDKYALNGIVAHHYCLLFSDDLEQNGSDRCGILGFQHKDISKHIKKIQYTECAYCLTLGASSRCKECKISFHRPCGIVKGGISIFGLNYYSLCGEHRKKKILSKEDVKEFSIETPNCYVCLDGITDIHNLNSLKTTCCSKSWLHRKCLTMLALSEGLNFNCPKCRDVNVFQQFAIQEGIYIPNRDYSWELEPNAFESHRRAPVCSINPCLHPSANNTSKKTRSLVVFCSTCGGSGAHKVCAKLSPTDKYLCQDCKDINEAITKRQLDEQEKDSQTIKKPRYDLNSSHEDSSLTIEQTNEEEEPVDVVDDQPSCSNIVDSSNELRKQPPRSKKRNSDFKYCQQSRPSGNSIELRKQPPRRSKVKIDLNNPQPSTSY